ncbi:polysaccharide deacetylase family protein [Flavobacterium ardleyense]|uniref:polysaccharide deacetylase family protein n=1 Tax=Flavobacterium ardleyense TaxID=2038737 RepID=UPI00298C6746|nr:polysaccharide deacetylase family protein [Flavobacterium ardleyense]
MFYWVKTHWIIKKIFSRYMWSKEQNDKVVYLTFDDGPTPQITDWVLQQLQQYNAKATFFCIGKNVEEQHEIFQRLLDSGNAVGNHTQNHINGWRNSTDVYLKNIEECENAIGNLPNQQQKYFRPPYGKITPRQATAVLQKGYKIVMWDVLSADFDQTITPEECLQNVLNNVLAGSIIIFHDSEKAWPNLQFALPKVLQFLKENDFECKLLD